jgi:recombination endonuclease VII
MPYKNPKKNSKCKAKWQKDNKEKHNDQSRRSYSKNKHKRRGWDLNRKGWTEELYGAVKKAQNSLCAICKNPCDNTHFGKLTADHKHVEPPMPRGLLCRLCNSGLGMFRDTPLLLRLAAEYLERYDNA